MVNFAEMTMSQIADLVDEKEPKCICGKILKGGLIKNYPHDGGITVKGYDRKQWVYVHCTCGYDMAIWKIKRALMAPEQERYTTRWDNSLYGYLVTVSAMGKEWFLIGTTRDGIILTSEWEHLSFREPSWRNNPRPT